MFLVSFSCILWFIYVTTGRFGSATSQQILYQQTGVLNVFEDAVRFVWQRGKTCSLLSLVYVNSKCLKDLFGPLNHFSWEHILGEPAGDAAGGDGDWHWQVVIGRAAAVPVRTRNAALQNDDGWWSKDVHLSTPFVYLKRVVHIVILLQFLY